MTELLAQYRSMLSRAEKLLQRPPFTPQKEKWLEDWRQMERERERATQQLELWNDGRR